MEEQLKEIDKTLGLIVIILVAILVSQCTNGCNANGISKKRNEIMAEIVEEMRKK